MPQESFPVRTRLYALTAAYPLPRSRDKRAAMRPVEMAEPKRANASYLRLSLTLPG
jgi:hypothetical protein